MKKIFYIFFIAAVTNIYSQTFPVKEIINNGDRDKRINVVFLGDGYTADQMNDFNNDVLGVVAELFEAEPYKSYKNYFNVYSIEVPSQESGSDHPGDANDEPAGTSVFENNTYFNSTYDYVGIHRLLVIQNHNAVNSVFAANFPDWDIAIFIINHEYYGGAGGSYATTSTNSSSFEVAIHEIGHSFARLADEYDYGPQNGFEAPNATAATTFQNIKWNQWIEASTPLPTPETSEYADVVGLFEGAVYSETGWYRPKLQCKMNVLFVPFCEVCAEQTVLTIYNYLNTIDKHFPEEQNQAIANHDSKEFSVETINPSSKNISVQWFLNNELIAEETKNYTIDASLLQPGNYKLKAVAKDNTEFVRKDPNNLLTSEFEWNINIENTTATDDDRLLYDYSLKQNYPNPFNPSTNIKYSLARSGNVTLKVFDIFGREVTTLIDNYKSTGNYEVNFNANELSSGVYFYVLSSGNFRDVKKLILVK